MSLSRAKIEEHIYEFHSPRIDLGGLDLSCLPEILAAPEHARRAPNARKVHRSSFSIRGRCRNRCGPGANTAARRWTWRTEAGVIFFIDRALKTFDAYKAQMYRDGLTELQRIREKMFPGSASMTALSNQSQIELGRAIETSDLFELLRVHTLLGFVGSPSYGGNRNSVGWKYSGFEDRLLWEPPFGYYDVEQGPYLHEKDYSHDEMKLYFSARSDQRHGAQPVTFRRHDQEPAKRAEN